MLVKHVRYEKLMQEHSTREKNIIAVFHSKKCGYSKQAVDELEKLANNHYEWMVSHGIQIYMNNSNFKWINKIFIGFLDL